jgi:hypothetical protein
MAKKLGPELQVPVGEKRKSSGLVPPSHPFSGSSAPPPPLTFPRPTTLGLGGKSASSSTPRQKLGFRSPSKGKR